jgi:hypothetical protein
MKVSELVTYLTALVEQGHGDLPVYAASDDEGNNYNEVWSEPGVVDPNDEKYVEDYGWHEDWPDTALVVL